jgi:hypothetical protein
MILDSKSSGKSLGARFSRLHKQGYNALLGGN